MWAVEEVYMLQLCLTHTLHRASAAVNYAVSVLNVFGVM